MWARWDCEALLSALHISGVHEVPDEEVMQKVSDKVIYYKTVDAAQRQKLSLSDRGLWASAHGKKERRQVWIASFYRTPSVYTPYA